MSHHQNLMNGMPPQMGGGGDITQQPMAMFNGVHSSQSSRDSSPSQRPFNNNQNNQIPSSQLPPSVRTSAIPSSQLPPQQSQQPLMTSQITQKIGQLSVNSTSSPFSTSTPTNLTTTVQKTSALGTSAFSPIITTNPTIQQTNNINNRPQLSPANRPVNGQSSNPGIPPLQNRQINYNNSSNNQPIVPNVPKNIPVAGQNQTPSVLSSRPPVMQNHQSVVSVLQPPMSQPQLPPMQGMYQPPKTQVMPPQNYNQINQNTIQPPLQSQYNQKPVASQLHANRYPQQQSQQFQNQYQSQSQPKQQSYQQYYQQQPQQSQQFHQQPGGVSGGGSGGAPYPGSVTHTGFNRLWGHDQIDLLQNPNILPTEKLEPPQIKLGQEALDLSNCSPDIFRCTITKIPENNSLLQKCRLPLGVLIHPFKDLAHLPVIQCHVIVRCRACRTYINPFVFFIDSKRWKCNLCYRINDLPEEFQYDPVTKTYGDPSRRPEIKSSTIEYIAPAEYMLRPPQPAVYLFLFDISRLAVESGYLQTVCSVLCEELKNLPGDARTQIGIIAYDSTLHFYSLGEGLSQPHEMTVLDIDDIFLPCPDNLLVNLRDRMDLIIDLLTQLPTRYNNCYNNSSALGAALQAGHKMMSATGGRITVFQATIPNCGPGLLQSREDPNQRTASEVTNLNPAIDFYKRLALDCSAQQIAVDLFIINSQYVDIATISGISQFSGGCIYHFPLFKACKVIDNERFERCFRRYLIRKIGFEAVMRIRCTRGLSIHTFHGNFFVRSTDLLTLPNINPDAGFGMQVSIDESLSDVQTVCFQAALLYTSSKGERRIRVHTMCLPVSANLSDIINSADQQCIIGLLAKMAVDRSLQSSLSDAREAFINVAIDILTSYKISMNLGNGMSGLIVPENLKLLPLYISALLKYTSFKVGQSTRLDDRVKAMIDMKIKPLPQLIQLIYPDLYPVHNLDIYQTIITPTEDEIPQPPHLQLTARILDSKGAFLMDLGEHMILLICPGISQIFLQQVLGVNDYISITDDFYELPILDNEHNLRLHRFINYLNDDKPFAATLHIIRDNSKHRVGFYERLIEDRVENALSYHEFLQHLKTQIK